MFNKDEYKNKISSLQKYELLSEFNCKCKKFYSTEAYCEYVGWVIAEDLAVTMDEIGEKIDICKVEILRRME